MNDINLFATGPAVLAFIATIFAASCFALSVSVLTLISSHTIGANRSFNKLLRLLGGYLLGVLLSVLAMALIAIKLVDSYSFFTTGLAWIGLGVISIIIGGLIIVFYYRRSQGTSLWVPRSFANFLNSRTKKTKSAVETFSLGVMTTIAELPFSFVPFLILAYLISDANHKTQLSLALVYALAVSLPLLYVAASITSGHKISSVQRWREDNKNFLRWSSGLCLVLLGFYLINWYSTGGLS